MNQTSNYEMSLNKNFKINPREYDTISINNLFKKRNYYQMLASHNFQFDKIIPKSLFSKKMKTTNSNGNEVNNYENIIIKKFIIPENIKNEIEKYRQENFAYVKNENSFCQCTGFYNCL